MYILFRKNLPAAHPLSITPVVGTAPVGLASLAGGILAGAVALLLISAGFTGVAWAITGGEVDQNNTYSNVGAGVWFPPDGSEPVIAFSGTLIHPRVLLTAGHVTWSGQQHPEWPPPYVSFGANAFDPSTWREIEAAITHPNYNPIAYCSQFANDVGVIILKQPIHDVPLAKLPSAGFLEDLKKAKRLRQPGQGGVPFKVVGYGSTLEWPPKVVTPGDGWRRFADSDYLNVLPGWLNLLQNPSTGNGGTAPGDSGGPVFWTDPDTGDEILVSITSWGGSWIGNGFYQRMDTVESLQFIQGVLDSLPAE